jgi:hypothetical protein
MRIASLFASLADKGETPEIALRKCNADGFVQYDFAEVS